MAVIQVRQRSQLEAPAQVESSASIHSAPIPHSAPLSACDRPIVPPEQEEVTRPPFSQNEDLARFVHFIVLPDALEQIHLANTNAHTDDPARRRTNLDASRRGVLEDPWDRVACLFNDYTRFQPENSFAQRDQRLQPFLTSTVEISKRQRIQRSGSELRNAYSKLRGQFTSIYERFKASGQYVGEGDEQEAAEFWNYCAGKSFMLYCFLVWRGLPVIDTVLRALPESSQSVVGLKRTTMSESSQSCTSSSSQERLASARKKSRRGAIDYRPFLERLAQSSEKAEHGSASDNQVNAELASYFAQKRALAEEDTLTRRIERVEALKFQRMQRLEMVLRNNLLSPNETERAKKQMVALALGQDDETCTTSSQDTNLSWVHMMTQEDCQKKQFNDMFGDIYNFRLLYCKLYLSIQCHDNLTDYYRPTQHLSNLIS